MADRPILMSAPMVRALLDGTKTQTRRLVKQQPPGLWMNPASVGITDGQGRWAYSRTASNGVAVAWPRGSESIKCPYGVPGYRLWVKEAMRRWEPANYRAGMECGALYSADETVVERQASAFIWQWKRASLPSMFCPRDASRLTLEVTDVRVQRLQDISEEDARAEGCPGESEESAAEEYAHLWNSINGPGLWDANPWVWAVTFHAVTQ